MDLTQRKDLSVSWPRHAIFLAAMGSVLATQSRIVAGIGLGEVAGVALIMATFGKRLATPLWAVAALLMMLLGVLVGAMFNQVAAISPIASGRDLLALLFSIAFALAALTHLRASGNPALAFSQGLTVAVIIQAVPLLLFAFGIETSAWLTDSDEPGIPFLSRYVGFSDNPNQLGMLLCGYPFAAIAGLRAGGGRRSRTVTAIGLILFVPVVVLVRSNTVFSAYIVSSTLWFALWLNQWHLPRAQRSRVEIRRTITAGLCLLAVAAFALYAGESVNKTEDADANGRFPLWLHALQGIGETYLLGAGPGGQSGDYGPFQGSESHNQLLDFCLQGGLIAMIAYLALITGTARKIIQARSYLSACMFTSILVEQLTHYTARQPISWIYLMLVFAMAAAERNHVRAAGPQMSQVGG